MACHSSLLPHVRYEIFSVGTGPPPSSRIPDRDFTDEEHDASQLLSRDKAQWEKADVDNDTVLAVDEFLSFQHPEQSKETVRLTRER